jgi:hypothetical protein
MSVIARRSSGVLGCVLTLHLSLLSGDLACGSHAAGQGDTAVPLAARGPVHDQHGAHAEHASHGPRGADDATPSDRVHDDAGQDAREACKTPSRERCCEALASCAVQFAFSGATIPVPPSSRDATLRGADALPASSTPSPDTPPPKA